MQTSERRRRESTHSRERNCGEEKGQMGSKSGGFLSSSSKKRPYGMLLLLAFGAAVLSVVVLSKLREKRVFGLLLEERERELLSLHILVQKERENYRELKTKMEEMKAKAISLRSEKMELSHKLMEAQNMAAYMKDKQKEMELLQHESQNKIKVLSEMESEAARARLQVKTLKRLLRRQEAKLEEMKHHLEYLSKRKDNATAPTISNGIITSNAVENSTLPDNKQPAVSGNLGDKNFMPIENVDVDGNETSTIKNEMEGGEQQKENSSKQDWVKLSTNMGSADKTEDDKHEKETADGTEYKNLNDSNHEETKNQTIEKLNVGNKEVEVLPAEDAANSNKTDREEQEAPKDSETEKHETLHSSEKLQVAAEGGEKAQMHGVKIMGEHTHRLRTKRRGHKMVPGGTKASKNMHVRDKKGTEGEVRSDGEHEQSNASQREEILKVGSESAEDNMLGRNNSVPISIEEAVKMPDESSRRQDSESTAVGEENTTGKRVQGTVSSGEDGQVLKTSRGDTSSKDDEFLHGEILGKTDIEDGHGKVSESQSNDGKDERSLQTQSEDADKEKLSRDEEMKNISDNSNSGNAPSRLAGQTSTEKEGSEKESTYDGKHYKKMDIGSLTGNSSSVNGIEAIVLQKTNMTDGSSHIEEVEEQHEYDESDNKK